MIIREHRWNTLCEALGLAADAQEFTRLSAAYSEPQRAYHTLQHLSECLQTLDWATSNSEQTDAPIAEIALWYHDAVYQPRASDNEANSADWAVQFLAPAGLGDAGCTLVRSLIMATCHGEQPQDATHQLVVDVDLAVLGADPQRFDEYEQQVRQEYRWVPWMLFKKKRRELLQAFLQTPYIYNTVAFRDRFEKQARENLARSIAQLS